MAENGSHVGAPELMFPTVYYKLATEAPPPSS